MDRFLRKLDIELIDGKHSKLSKRWQIENDNTPYARLYYIKNGSGYMRTHDKDISFKPNHLYLVPPRGNLAYNYIADLEIWWVHFTIKVFDSIDLFDYLNYKLERQVWNNDYLEIEMDQLIIASKNDDVQSQMLGNGLLLKLIAPFFSDFSKNTSAAEIEQMQRFAPVISYIDNNIGEKITLEQLASLVNYERTYFSSLFTDIFKISPIRFILRKRIERAMFRLETTNCLLEEISEELGFSDAYHFSKTFKQYTGIAPTAFRRQRLELDESIP